MDLIGSLADENNFRGITLTSDLIYLFNLIEENKKDEVYAFLEGILQGKAMYEEMESQGLTTGQKIKKVVEEKLDYLSDKKSFLGFLNTCNLMQIRAHMDTRESLESYFKSSNIQVESEYIDAIIDMKKYILHQQNGISSFCVDENGHTVNPKSSNVTIDREKTYQKAKALYDYVTGKLKRGEERFNSLTFDGQGKFGTVAGMVETEQERIDAQNEEITFENYNLEPLRQGYDFAKKHGMDVRINTLVFFKDFPDRLIGASKEEMKTALINYGKAVASIVNEYQTRGVNTKVDMFNEFVDYFEPFSIRTNNWMSKLSIEDLCEVALTLKKEMPEADFGYNDWNFENADKRKSIFEVLKRIQAFEDANHCKIINHIGTQCHTSINDFEGLRDSIEELSKFGLPIYITELDISKELDGIDIYKKTKDGEYEKDDNGEKIIDYDKVTPEQLSAIRKKEQKKQNDIMKMLAEYAKQGIIRGITEWSITDELCCDFCNGKHASITGMEYNGNTFMFFGKEIQEIELTDEEEKLIEEHIKEVKKRANNEVIKNPTQDFCFHTHTSRCGHGAKDTGDEEWVEHAIKGGIKKLAFTDHIPLPDGMNHKANSRMDIAEVDSYLTSIKYLKETYEGQIEIESGFEFEYSDRDSTHLQELKSKTDKMVLGQHFVIDKNGNEYGIERIKSISQVKYEIFDESEVKSLEGKTDKEVISAYTSKLLDLYEASIISAIDKGLPDVIAHPDLFMQMRDNFGEREEELTRDICRKAIEKGIPLEINFGKIASKIGSDMSLNEMKKNIPYPSPEFWKIVAEETRIAKENGQDLLVIFGKDAHFPQQLSTEKDYEIAKTIIGEQTLGQLHIVTKYKELETQTKKKTTEERKISLLKARKINTPVMNEADKKCAIDQREMEQENEGHNNYGE